MPALPPPLRGARVAPGDRRAETVTACAAAGGLAVACCPRGKGGLPPALAASLVLPVLGMRCFLQKLRGRRGASAELLVVLCLVALGQLSAVCFLEEIAMIKLLVYCTVSRVGGIPRS